MLNSSFSHRFDKRWLRRALPGYVATALIIVVTLLWTFWSVGELYYEGWGGPGTFAYFVSYSGAFNVQPKSWGNPRHGHRCVREP